MGQRVDREQVLAGQRQASSSVSVGSSSPRPLALNFADEWCCGGSSPAGGEVHRVATSPLPGPSPRPAPPGSLAPRLHSHMWSCSWRAFHFSFISFLLDTTCCSFSLICGEEGEMAQALVTLPPV